MEFQGALFSEDGVVELSHAIARPFIEKWHYSGRCPTGKNIFYGWYFDGSLYAVADYGIGVNPYQAGSLSKITGIQIQSNQLLELKRLCRVEPKDDKKQLTRFISLCHKRLKLMGYKYVVSFSDPAFGHNGGIYRAANFSYLGKTNPEWHVVDSSGEVRHRKYYFRYARRNNVDVITARKELGLTKIKTIPKDRWFICI